MKANAPEKIYVHVKDGKAFNIWNSEWIGVNDIEYTRTDALIEKACEFLAGNMKCDGYTLQTKAKFIRGFRNYMKGE